MGSPASAEMITFNRLVPIAVLPSVAICAMLGMYGCASATSQGRGEPAALRDNAPRHVTVLADDVAPLRSAFNDRSDQWRAVALVSPTCSECLLGAEAVEREITSRYPASQVPALIVWIPMLPSDSERAARSSATIFRHARASQFYDSRQSVGWVYARETFAGFPERARRSLPEGHWLTEAFDDRAEVLRPQWDLYMLYAPGVHWEEGNGPPLPTHWIRHFGREDDRKTSIYWQDTPESGPREGDLYAAIRAMADGAIGGPRAMGPAIKIEVLGFEGCPNILKAKANVEKAVDASGIAARVVYVDQMKLPEGDRRRRWPSPTVLVDGRDLFGMPEPHGQATGCRMYKDGAPSDVEIVEALRSMGLTPSAGTEPPIACTLTPEQLSASREALLPGLFDRADERTPLEGGYRLRFAPRIGLLEEIASVVQRERRCCRFLKFQITVEPDNGPIYLDVTGPAGTRELLEAM